jgi:hypothetical protein
MKYRLVIVRGGRLLLGAVEDPGVARSGTTVRVIRTGRPLYPGGIVIIADRRERPRLIRPRPRVTLVGHRRILSLAPYCGSTYPILR